MVISGWRRFTVVLCYSCPLFFLFAFYFIYFCAFYRVNIIPCLDFWNIWVLIKQFIWALSKNNTCTLLCEETIYGTRIVGNNTNSATMWPVIKHYTFWHTILVQSFSLWPKTIKGWSMHEIQKLPRFNFDSMNESVTLWIPPVFQWHQ